MRRLYPAGWIIVIRCSTVCRHSAAQVAVCVEHHCTIEHWHAMPWSYHTGTTRTLLATHRRLCRVQSACLVCQSLSGRRLYLADDCCLPRARQHSALSAVRWRCVVPWTFGSYCDRTFAAAGPRLFNSLPVSCAIQTSPTDCSDDSWKDNYFGKHEHGALWLLICGALEKHLLTYLQFTRLTDGQMGGGCS